MLVKNILFISSGSIGDAIMSTGILGWLIDTQPDARFTIAAGTASAPIFSAFPRLDKLIPVQKLPYNRHWIKLWNATRGTRWNLVVDLRGSLLSYFIATDNRKIFHSPDKSLSKAEQLASLFQLSPPPPTRLYCSMEARAKAADLLKGSESKQIIIIAPKTNSTAKDWPIERFAELAQKICHNERTLCVVLASQAQKESVQPLVQALPADQMLDLSGKTDLMTAMAVIERAQLFIGNDSGLLHMAAALGINCVGLYGPSNDKTYAPRGTHVHIITSANFKPGEPEKRDVSYMLKISVDEVQGVVSKIFT